MEGRHQLPEAAQSQAGSRQCLRAEKRSVERGEINCGASLPNVLLQILNCVVPQDKVPGGSCLAQPEITLSGG